jgi:hypothetical protein
MDGLLNILKEIKTNRIIGSEADKLLEPFHGKSGEFSFSVIEVSTTFSTRHGELYKGGKTILAKIMGTDLKGTILFSKEENKWINGLALGNEFSCRVKVLQFDRLYDRVVLGEVFENDELELAKPEPQSHPIAEELEDISIKSGRVELDEDFEKERFRLLNLLTETIQRKPQIFAASYSENAPDKESMGRENTLSREEAEEIGRITFKSIWGSIIIFFSIGGYMSGKLLYGLIPSFIGFYLLYPLFKKMKPQFKKLRPLLKKLKGNYKNDKGGLYSMIFAFVLLAISYSVESKKVHIFLFCAAGCLLLTSFKKKLAENYEKY